VEHGANLLNRGRDRRHILPRVTGDAPLADYEAQALNLTGTVLALSGLMLSAGTIHLVAIVQHLDSTWTLPFFFGLVGAGQFYVAWAAYSRRDDHDTLVVAAVANFVVALLWLLSRTVGLPFGPEQGTSAIGVSDTIASLEELAFAAIVLGIVRDPARSERRLAWFASPMGLRVTLMCVSSTLFIAALGGHRH
jgi:hypothetical protein